jgi:hypothetical protein
LPYFPSHSALTSSSSSLTQVLPVSSAGLNIFLSKIHLLAVGGARLLRFLKLKVSDFSKGHYAKLSSLGSSRANFFISASRETLWNETPATSVSSRLLDKRPGPPPLPPIRSVPPRGTVSNALERNPSYRSNMA